MLSNSFVMTNLLKNTKKSMSVDLIMKEKEQKKDKELANKEKFANYLSSFVSINMINDLNFKHSVLNNNFSLGSMIINEEQEQFETRIKNKMKIIQEKSLFKDSTPQVSKIKANKDSKSSSNQVKIDEM